MSGVKKDVSKSSCKSEKAKRKIRLAAKKPQKIKAAIKAWVTSSEKMDCDALNLAGSPAWAENALAEVVKIVLPGRTLPTEGEWDVELLGELVGRQHAFAKLYAGEIPMSTEMKSDLEKIKRQEAALPQTPERKARKKRVGNDFSNLVQANNQAIPQLMTAVMESSHEDSLKFQQGLSHGLNLVAEELNSGRIKQRHTQTFWELGINWRKYHECRSVAEVYRKLCQKYGEKQIGSQKHFEERVAKKIGMSFGPAGRPSKGK